MAFYLTILEQVKTLMELAFYGSEASWERSIHDLGKEAQFKF